MTLRLLSTLIAAFLLAACQTVGNDDITGIYYLVTVDGSAVPGEVSHDGQMLRVSSGVFVISGDGTCFSRTRFVTPDGTEMTREVGAKYRVEDARLIMQWEGAGTTEGTVDGDTFVMDNHGMRFEYTRR